MPKRSSRITARDQQIRFRHFTYGATIAVLAESYKLPVSEIERIIAQFVAPPPTFRLPLAPVMVQLKRAPERRSLPLPRRSLHPDGYVIVRHGDLFKDFEHRLVMAAVIGRRLTPDEHVHHDNEVPSDNAPSNLSVMTPAEHRRLHAARGDSARTSVCVNVL